MVFQDLLTLRPIKQYYFHQGRPEMFYILSACRSPYSFSSSRATASNAKNIHSVNKLNRFIPSGADLYSTVWTMEGNLSLYYAHQRQAFIFRQLWDAARTIGIRTNYQEFHFTEIWQSHTSNRENRLHARMYHSKHNA